MGYPTDLLSSRAIVKPGLWAVIPKGGLVNNVVPNISNCRISIVASPKMGAGFVQYIIDAEPKGGTTIPFAAEPNIEAFIYCVSGSLQVSVGNETESLKPGGYAFSPAGYGIFFENIGDDMAKILLYKQIYIPFSGATAKQVWGNVHDLPYRLLDGMDNVYMIDLLPTDIGFDMNMHILAFEPGGSHSIVETHVQEHGAYVLKGEGMYYLDDRWMGIKKEDFIWFGPYVPQCAYGVGREMFAYIYSKDCNRDVEL